MQQTAEKSHYRQFSVAPMMAWTDRHYRMLARSISRHAVLYTEMVTTGALRHSDPARHLDYNAQEHPVVLQVGGSEPDDMAYAAELAERWGYAAVNINCGCPSPRVQRGAFGACLMQTPETVAACAKAMQAASSLPVTVKCRIGVDRDDAYEPLLHFVSTLADVGVSHFDVHARKAWLDGLSPAQNREIPPLRYGYVKRLKSELPALTIILNGGLSDWETVEREWVSLDGVMVGREAYRNPWFLADVDRQVAGEAGPVSRMAVAAAYRDYVLDQIDAGVPLMACCKHVLGLFNGLPGARQFRRQLSEHGPRAPTDIGVLDRALECVA
ncbi:MAG: tRNA dihydrouridine(20/20a) synthase DusA [Pseudomonadota bacterium]